MTRASAEAVLDRLEVDETFAERVREAGTPEASIVLLETEGFDVTPGDMRDAVLDRYGEAMTPEQLDQIAGGVEADANYWLGVAAWGIAVSAAVLAAV